MDSKNYRQAYNIHASNGILFNHESPRRGETFVTQKIVIGACNIKLGIQDKLVLGNLNAKRDWGYAPEYVEGMWRILQHKNSDDYVLATGQTYSIKYFVEKCFQYLGIKISWIGSGINEHAIKKNNKKIVVIDEKYFRPNEVDLLVGDSRKANKILKWKSKTSVDNLIKLMIDSKINELKKHDGIKHKKILITGGSGFLGKNLISLLKNKKINNYFSPRKKDYNLLNVNEIKKLFQDYQPDIVIHLAAVVGGIGANANHPAKFFYENAMMGLQLFHQSYLNNINKFVCIGTICSYPSDTKIPFKESDLWNGFPEETNAPYGIAKKMLSVQSSTYRQEYGFNSIYLMPVNMYGPYDNFNDQTSHVIPAVIKKNTIC